MDHDKAPGSPANSPPPPKPAAEPVVPAARLDLGVVEQTAGSGEATGRTAADGEGDQPTDKEEEEQDGHVPDGAPDVWEAAVDGLSIGTCGMPSSSYSGPDTANPNRS